MAIEKYDDEKAIDELINSVDYDLKFPEDVDAKQKAARLDPLNYNLVADADADCLTGDCDHFCGYPTQYDLERMVARGYATEVENYENGVTTL